MEEQQIDPTEAYIRELENEIALGKVEKGDAARGQVAMFNQVNEDNLIRWQLDLKEDLNRIYHLLHGHKLVEDEEGNLIYIEPEDSNQKPFNEQGVHLIMNIMAFYLNRNTILSNYKEDIINWKVLDFGNDIADLIFNKYQEMGMDTPEKRKLYPMIVRELVDTVHSAYLRAFNGGERESLRTARTVTQSEPVGFSRNQIHPVPTKQSKWYNPTTWAN